MAKDDDPPPSHGNDASAIAVLEEEVRSLRTALYGRGIEKTPGVCGGSARIVRTRIPVWTLQALRRKGMTEAEMLTSYPTLAASDLVSAWAYAESHQDEIDSEIAENESD